MNKLEKQTRFQGNLKKKKNYFEGWYFKQVNKEGQSIAFIPGVSINKKDSHSFIQMIDNIENKSYYFRFKLEEFKYQNNPFSIQIANNYFSLEHIEININQEIKVKADIILGKKEQIDTSKYSPTIMGPFSYFPFMECNHGVISLNHALKGYVKINNQKINFNKGFGYIEKDYGTSFPKDYIWLQSNTPDKKIKASIFLSIAHIPYSLLTFQGFICILKIDNKQYRFATYNFGKVKKIEARNNMHYIEIEQGKFTLIINIKQNNIIELASPKKGRMKESVFESLNGEAQVILKEKGIIIFDEYFHSCGCEITKQNQKKQI